MEKYILSLDQGTSSSRAILVNHNGEIIGLSQKEIKQYYPKPGWVEQDPLEIWQSQLDVARDVLERNNIPATAIAAIGITNQRETTVVWNKNTGLPVYKAIVWQDKRTSDFCREIKESTISGTMMNKTGLVIDSYFSATKLHWILENVPNARAQAEKGELLFGTIDSWVIWNLSKKHEHITDYTNASRTMLFNIQKLVWDKQLLQFFNIPLAMMPTVNPSSHVSAVTDKNWFGGIEIPISGIAGDQQAALFGQTGFDAGSAKNTYGTGCFILAHTGSEYVNSKHGLITTLTCDTLPGQPKYALEGSVFVAGAAIKWLRDGLRLIDKAAQTEEIAEKVENSDGIYVVPAFNGLGAPYWDMFARGAIFGLTLGSTQEHIVRATLESLAYQSKDVIKAMEQDSGIAISCLNVDGGAASNNYLMQFQSDLLNTTVSRPANVESTAMGAAYLAGLAIGFWNSRQEIIAMRKESTLFSPKMDESTRYKLYSGWKKAVSRAMEWEKTD